MSKHCREQIRNHHGGISLIIILLKKESPLTPIHVNMVWLPIKVRRSKFHLVQGIPWQFIGIVMMGDAKTSVQVQGFMNTFNPIVR